MRRFSPAALCLLLLILAGAATFSQARKKEALNEYAARRARLLAKVNGPVVLFGYGGGVFGISGEERTSPETTFRQDENFYYLTGHNQPGAALLLIPQTEAARQAELPSEVLFLPPREPNQERWEGVKVGPGDPDIGEKTGFAAVQAGEELRPTLEKALRVFDEVWTLTPRRGATDGASHTGRWFGWLRGVAPLEAFHNVRGQLAELRQVKSESELELLRFAIEKSMDAHREAMRALRPRMYEYEIAALMEYTAKRAGCERFGYAPIVGSGFNSTVLHYDQNSRQMQAGDVVVIDVGAECNGYTADITRTLPVSGRYTDRQREIYEIVLGAQNAAIAAVKPGMSFSRRGENSIYKIAYDYINSHGTDNKGEPLGKYFIHGLSHHIGLAVHDPGSSGPLRPGMIFTVEPGIYIPEENLGVRIEDIVLVTETGAELVTRSLPRTVDEIETFMAASGRQ